MTAERPDSAERNYPIYRETDNDLPPGLYLALFHGFEDEEARQKHYDAGGGQGANGPVIGPLRFVQTTYGNLVRPAFVGKEQAAIYGLEEGMPSLDLDTQSGCIVFDGMQFGDWCMFAISDKATAQTRTRKQEFIVRAFTRHDVAFALDAEPGLAQRIQGLSDEEMRTIADRIAEDLNAEFYRLLERIAEEHLRAGEE